MKHIQDKVELVRVELNSDPVPLTDATLSDALWSAGDILVELLARIRERELSDLHHQHNDKNTRSEDQIMTTDDGGTDYLNPIDEADFINENRPYNQRVVLPSAKDADAFETNSYNDDVFDDLDGEELSRDIVKKASTQIIKAQERKKAREQGRT